MAEDDPPEAGAASTLPDPREIGTQADFAEALRRLRTSSGAKSYRALAMEMAKQFPATAPKVATIGDWLSGSHLPTSGSRQGFIALLHTLGVHEQTTLRWWLEALDRLKSQPGPRPRGASAPYRGLAAYEPEHAQYFCGREATTAELAGKLGEASRNHQPIVVVGPSGCGKSSLLRAGLIPALCAVDTAEPGYCIIVPGVDPVGDLATALSRHLRKPLEVLTAALNSDPDLIAQQTAEALVECRAGPTTLLIVVDQLEQLFAGGTARGEQEAFVAALMAAARGGAMVVMGLRSDFYSRVLEFPMLLKTLQTAQFVLGPMSQQELRRAITEPARNLGLRLQPGLVEVIQEQLASTRARHPKDAAYDAGALPLLSHALLATWEQAKGVTLTIEHYQETGGISGAVAKSAEQAYSGLRTDARHEIARWIFLRLVQSNDDTADTRRRVPLAELLDMGDTSDEEDIRAVLAEFVDARLLTSDDGTVEIAHEALLSAWPRLVDWLETAQAWRQVHRRLRGAAQQWQATGRSEDALYRGGVLLEVREWAEQPAYRGELSRLERDFIASAIRRHDAEAVLVARQRHRRQRAFAALAALLVLATGGIGYGIQLNIANSAEQARATQARAQALSRLTASKADRLRERDPALAMQLALAAYRIDPTPEARSSLLNATAFQPGTRARPGSGDAKSVAASADGLTVAAGTSRGTVQLWRFNRDEPVSTNVLSTGTDTALVSLDLSFNGRVVVAGGRNGSVYLWRLDSGEAVVPTVLADLRSEVLSVAISDDEHTLAAAAGSAVAVWILPDAGVPPSPARLTGPAGTVRSLAFSSSGDILAAGGNDSAVYLWRLGPVGAAAVAVLSEPTSRVFSVAISPDGRTLAAGTGAEHLVYLWDISEPASSRLLGTPLAGPASWINTVAFDPAGRTLAAGSSDNLLWLYDLRTWQVIGQLPHPDPVTGSAFRGDRLLATVATVATDGSIRLWPVPGPMLVGAKDSVFAVDFDGTGDRLGVAAGAGDNTLAVWNTTDRHRPLPESLTPNGPDAPRFSGAGALTPDGGIFIVGDVDGNVHLWDIGQSGESSRIGGPIDVADDLIEAVTVSQDGKVVAACSDDGTVRLIDISEPASPEVVATLQPQEPSGLMYYAAFRPDGRQIAAAGINHLVYLWDISDVERPKPQATLHGFTEAAYSVAYNHDGTLLAAGSADRTTRIWDVSEPDSPTLIGDPLTGPVGYIYSIAFRADRDVLATGSTDGTVWLWELSNRRQPTHLATLTGTTKGILSIAFSPAGDQLAGGGHDRVVRIWNTDPQAASAWVCAVRGLAITQAEWSSYLPGRAYRDPCTQ